MVVDSSALLAILLQEEDAERFAQAIEAVERPLISSGTVIEAGIVLIVRQGPAGRVDLIALLEEGGFGIEPVTVEQTGIALETYQRYGKGRGHAAGLNYGDCFAYALAKATGEPLLFKGDDFAHTDIEPA